MTLDKDRLFVIGLVLILIAFLFNVLDELDGLDGLISP